MAPPASGPVSTPALEIEDLHVSVEDHEILRGVSLQVEPGSLHALMGPNGSGKSTLANTLLANPAYVVTAGRILLQGEDITALPTDERAQRGLFLGFQHPEEIPGVSVLNFLRQAIAKRKGIDDFSVLEVRLSLIDWTKRLGMDTRFQERYLNEGFSGGEKKRNEVLQMAMMEPDVAVLDETDSGLDIDALRQVAAGIAEVRNARPHMGILAITHYQRLLEHLVPDVVHVLVDGRIVATGGPEISKEVEARGFDAFRVRDVDSAEAGAVSALDVATIKRDFPIFEREVNGKRLVYLDSASSAQKPFAVLDAMDDSYRNHYANIHRGVYTIAEEATAAFEDARRKVARFVNAPRTDEIIFTRNATESINLVAYTWARANLGAGDAIVLSHMEHHANVVPWQILAAERGVELRWIPMTADFRLDLSDLDALLDGARLLAISAMSNVLGTINDIRPLADAAHAHGALVLVDARQFVPHVATDVQEWDADFVAFSSHKILGPTGIGALWARMELLEAMPPFLGGGEMIRDVRLEGFTTNDVPWKFEAGTPAIVEAVGFGAALDYISALGMDAVRAHEMLVTRYALEALHDRFGESLTIYGPTDVDVRGGAVSFLFDGIHAHDISQVLDEDAVCVRAGHHCAKPLMRRLGVPATTRASFYVYNDESDVDALVEALAKAQKFFAV